MADTAPPPELAPDDLLRLVDHHRPALVAGDYTLRVDHPVGPAGATPLALETTVRFTVAGERFSLPPDRIHAVYPPPGADGDFQGHLPHVVLTRSTLPWERRADADAEHPWLAVLLFTAGEAPRARTVSAGEAAPTLGLDLESSQHAEDPVVLIDVPADLLRAVLPRPTELSRLVHVREIEHVRGVVGREAQAVVVGSRIVQPNRAWVAHLVSLEGRLAAVETTLPTKQVALVSLHAWRFHSSAAGPDLVGLLEALDLGPRAGAIGNIAPPGLPAAALPFVRAGYTLLPYLLRTGDETIAWYRGPFVPLAPRSVTLPVPTRTPDALLRLDRATGCLDATWAAAWTLGRMLALEDPRFGVELLHYKRAHRRGIAAKDAVAAAVHSPHDGPPDLPPPPDLVVNWLARLALLTPVPFNHLLPDEALLPVESLRFFQVDPDWIHALLDGAFSLGRVLRGDELRDENWLELLVQVPQLRGVLIRSAAVRGYPSLEVDAWSAQGTAPAFAERAHAFLPHERFTRLTCLRRARLGPDVLLCLFDGTAEGLDVDVLDVHLHPQALHLGLERDGDALVKDLKHPTTGDPSGARFRPRWRDPARGVLDVDALHATLSGEYGKRWSDEAFTAGDLAFQLLDAPPLVRFQRPETVHVELIEGVGPRLAQALAEAGITHMGQLQALARRDPATWPRVQGVSPMRLQQWVHHADLMRLPGVDEHVAELFEDLGITGVAGLAQITDVDDLHARMVEDNRRRTRVPAVPDLETLARMVLAARNVRDGDAR